MLSCKSKVYYLRLSLEYSLFQQFTVGGDAPKIPRSRYKPHSTFVLWIWWRRLIKRLGTRRGSSDREDRSVGNARITGVRPPEKGLGEKRGVEVRQDGDPSPEVEVATT